jgi:chemotaxis protein CheC
MEEIDNQFGHELISYLQIVAKQGIHNAARGFSGLLGKSMSVTEPVIRLIPFAEIPMMLGGPEEEAVGIYLMFEGDIPGQMILIIPIQRAKELVALLLEIPVEQVQSLGSLERSALGEMGNMTGTFFLNSVAELTGLSVRPSIPAVMVDMVGSILDIIVATTGGLGPNVLMFQATFVYGEHKTKTDFWVIPDPNTVNYIASKVKPSHV